MLSSALPTFSQEIEITVISANNKEKKPGSFSLDKCKTVFKAVNNTGQDAHLELGLKTVLKDGSFSAAIADATSSLGASVFHGKISAGEALEEKETLIGVDCDHLGGLLVLPDCSFEGQGRGSCNQTITATADSVVAIGLPGADPVGGPAAPEPAQGGPMQGKWQVRLASGEVVVTLDITDDNQGTLGGDFVCNDAICPVLGEPSGCNYGKASGAVDRFSGFQEFLTGTIIVGDSGVAEVIVIWNPETMTGFLRNQAGSINLKILLETAQ